MSAAAVLGALGGTLVCHVGVLVLVVLVAPFPRAGIVLLLVFYSRCGCPGGRHVVVRHGDPLDVNPRLSPVGTLVQLPVR